MSGLIEWDALGQVVLAGIVVGAGIPALFALGLRLLVVPRVADGDATVAEPARRPGAARLVGGFACFAVVVAAIVTGLAFLVAGGH
jgi:hypothetical protein